MENRTSTEAIPGMKRNWLRVEIAAKEEEKENRTKFYYLSLLDGDDYMQLANFTSEASELYVEGFRNSASDLAKLAKKKTEWFNVNENMLALGSLSNENRWTC